MRSLLSSISSLADYCRGIHFGVGINFLYYNKNVYVASRLVDSPAGRAGVPNHVQVIAIDGVKCFFGTSRAFQQFVLAEIEKKSSYELTFRFGAESRSVLLVKEKVLKKFPTYGWYPDQCQHRMEKAKQLNRDGYKNWGYIGKFYCGLTGQDIHQFDYTHEGLKAIYIGRRKIDSLD